MRKFQNLGTPKLRQILKDKNDQKLKAIFHLFFQDKKIKRDWLKANQYLLITCDANTNVNGSRVLYLFFSS